MEPTIPSFEKGNLVSESPANGDAVGRDTDHAESHQEPFLSGSGSHAYAGHPGTFVQKRCSLNMNDISRATGVSQTTTYRILRTLVHRGYLSQDLEGRFSMLNRPELKNASLDETSEANSRPVPSRETDLSGEQVIEILQRPANIETAR